MGKGLEQKVTKGGKWEKESGEVAGIKSTDCSVPAPRNRPKFFPFITGSRWFPQVGPDFRKAVRSVETDGSEVLDVGALQDEHDRGKALHRAEFAILVHVEGNERGAGPVEILLGSDLGG